MIFNRWDKSTRGCADTIGGCLGLIIGLTVLAILILIFLA